MEKIKKGIFSLEDFTKKELITIMNRVKDLTLIGNLKDVNSDSIVSLNDATHVVKSIDVFENKLEVLCEPLSTPFAKEVFKSFNDYYFEVVPRFLPNGDFITFDIKPIVNLKNISIVIEKVRPDGLVEENKSFNFEFTDESDNKFKSRLFLTIGDFKYFVSDKGEILDKI